MDLSKPKSKQLAKVLKTKLILEENDGYLTSVIFDAPYGWSGKEFRVMKMS